MAEHFDFAQLSEKWQSPLVARSEVKNFSGGLLNGRTLANLDSQGRGPRGKVVVGRRVAYTAKSLVEFLEERARRRG
ncbi:hypothetical protein [Geoalkalibacter subterraneus]|uniref:hypothetical protein n=1 Tax=Geoalkalibacter subterraneus TaxID=483547 RepID=UPI000694F549|nr:hypothetical protein [Geoalkalibacter subterraneus]